MIVGDVAPGDSLVSFVRITRERRVVELGVHRHGEPQRIKLRDRSTCIGLRWSRARVLKLWVVKLFLLGPDTIELKDFLLYFILGLIYERSLHLPKYYRKGVSD